MVDAHKTPDFFDHTMEDDSNDEEDEEIDEMKCEGSVVQDHMNEEKDEIDSEPGGGPGSRVHDKTLQKQTRRLETWKLVRVGMDEEERLRLQTGSNGAGDLDEYGRELRATMDHHKEEMQELDEVVRLNELAAKKAVAQYARSMRTVGEDRKMLQESIDVRGSPTVIRRQN